MPDRKEYIVTGALCRCDIGTAPAVPFKGTVNFQIKMGMKPVCTVMDKMPGANLPPTFGTCSLKPPTMPMCVPIPTLWTGFCTKVRIKMQPALLKGSKLPCAIGGMISFVNSGQNS